MLQKQVGLADMSELEVAGTDVAGLGDVGDWFDAVEDEPDEPPAAVTVASKTYHLRTVASSDTKSSICLFADAVWNGARLIAEYLDREGSALVARRAILELGAAAALPSLVARDRGARAVVVTDYPASALLDNIAENFARNPPARAGGAGDAGGAGARVRVLGHLWGAPVEPLLAAAGGRFDVVIAAECLWRHEQHADLCATIARALRRPSAADADGAAPRALVAFSHHIPGLEAKDLGFFERAAACSAAAHGGDDEGGAADALHLKPELVLSREMPHMFTANKTTTQFLYQLTWERRSGAQ